MLDIASDPIEEIGSSRRRWRVVAAVALVAALSVAVWFQRDTVTGALGEIKNLSVGALVLLGILAVYERWSRADVVCRLLGQPVGIGQAVVIHDVGTAVSKGVPLGGALGTAMRWSIARECGVAPTRFATMLVAYGVATTFVTWLLPFVALSVDLTQRSAEMTDVLILGFIAVVVVASGVFWAIILRSERLEAWSATRTRSVWRRIARKIPALDAHDPAAGIAEVRRELLEIARRPVSLLLRTGAAQACGSLILLVALRSLGVGDELGLTEFFRVFFIAHLLGTFAPTPGGVGVVEAGTTGALVAAGVDTTSAFAAVLIYRFLTYVLPIVFGAVLWTSWRASRSRLAPVRSVTLATHGARIDTRVSDVSRTTHQRLRNG